MTESPLKWGLLSTANINKALITPLRASERNRLEAVASRTQDKADAYALEWQIPRALGSYEALLSDPDIDVIYNPLPNSMHAEWTIKALRAGKHVLCEKPLAMTLAEVDRMAAAAKETGKVLFEAFMYRYHPQTLKVKEIVESGVLGKVMLVKGSFSFTLDREEDIRLMPELGGGSIWDVGCYPISYIRTVLGMEPTEVFGQQVTGPLGADVTFVGQMRFAGDVYAQFDCGFRFPQRWHIEIVGSAGTLDVPSPYKPGENEKIILTHADEEGTVETIEIAGQELYIGEVEAMADAVLLGKPPRVSLVDSRANTAAILALLESAHSGKPVAL